MVFMVDRDPCGKFDTAIRIELERIAALGQSALCINCVQRVPVQLGPVWLAQPHLVRDPDPSSGLDFDELATSP